MEPAVHSIQWLRCSEINSTYITWHGSPWHGSPGRGHLVEGHPVMGHPVC